MLEGWENDVSNLLISMKKLRENEELHQNTKKFRILTIRKILDKLIYKDKDKKCSQIK